MNNVGHKLYRGEIFAKVPESLYTYHLLDPVDVYIEKMKGNLEAKAILLEQGKGVIRVLSSRNCCVIKQLEFNTDVFEISGGHFYDISKRKFINWKAVPNVSPRKYFLYDITKEPHPQYFIDSIKNSWPNLIQSTRFLNKFLQCLSVRRMDHKSKKLVVVGPKDCGKTTWFALIKACLTSPKRVAVITNEGSFAFSQVNEDTEIINMDEFSNAKNLDADTIKKFFQGGDVAVSRKYSDSRNINLSVPYFITTNDLPDYGKFNDSVLLRLYIVNAQSLPSLVSGMMEWYEENAFECILWAVNQVERYKFYIEPEELRYLKCPTAQTCLHKIDVQSEYDKLLGASMTVKMDYGDGTNVLNKSFGTVARQFLELSESDSDEEEQTVPKSKESLDDVVLNTVKSCVDFVVDNLTTDEDDEDCVPQGRSCKRKRRLVESDTDDEDYVFRRKFFPPSEMNTTAYLRHVRLFIRADMNDQATPLGLISFRSRERKIKKDHVLPDVYIDGWNLVTGQKRHCFDEEKFFNTYPDINDKLNQIRNMCKFTLRNNRSIAEELNV